MNKRMFWAAILVALVMTTGCGKDTPPEPGPTPGPDTTQTVTPDPEPAPQIGDSIALKNGEMCLIETTLKNADGMSGSSYIQLTNSLSGSVDNSKAIQIGFASTITVIDNYIFVLPSMGKDADFKLRRYTYNPSTQTMGDLKTIDIPAGASPFNVQHVASDKIYMPNYLLGNVWVLNPATLTKTGEIDLKQYAYKDASPEPSCGILRGDLYFLTLNQIGGDFMPYADRRQVEVAVIDAKTDKVLKVITENSLKLSFPTRPLYKDMIFADESGDIYIACTGYFGYNPNYRENGFVCIPAGKDDFDASRSWDISGVKIDNSKFTSSAILNCKYLGNGKVAAFVAIMELNGSNPYTSKSAMAVMIDLRAKTVTRIVGIPMTDGHSTAIETYGNTVLFGAFGEKQSGLFTYNPTTGKAGLALSTVGNLAFMHLFSR